ncbi:hypothetical protein KVT40_000572 [Elsinoe batatas]|uniref:Efficient mitochondria targeting-associated protein 19 n=1 Tax=Elsinoe batatas TaxID=2601811 RepID=A0A8K0L906_9PEZI|nr:hypothetical protein KVT40_000572 [Elsinoe batatas]
MATSVFSRKTDLFYLVFFCIHLVVMFNVDLVSLYPDWLKQKYMLDLRKWQVATYKDQFFVSPPAWFTLYTYLELLYHVPFCLWAIPALKNNDPRVPIQLLIYALETGITTITCIADYMSWTVISRAEVNQLHTLYVPYLAISVFMGVDMVARLNAVVAGARPPPTVAGKKTR